VILVPFVAENGLLHLRLLRLFAAIFLRLSFEPSWLASSLPDVILNKRIFQVHCPDLCRIVLLCSVLAVGSLVMNDAIAALIRSGRLRKGLNQSELAEQAGVSRTTLHQLERGAVQEPRAKTLSRIAAALDLPPESLAPSDAAAFDRGTNPAVAAARADDPQRLPEAAWADLAGTFGVGGALTSDGVEQLAARSVEDAAILHRLRVVLQTHLREPARRVVEALYQSVQVLPEAIPSPPSPQNSESAPPDQADRAGD
jgi:transcriptional regulator with XRE-family HTH domain